MNALKVFLFILFFIKISTIKIRGTLKSSKDLNIEIYTLNSKYESIITFPSNKKKFYQIKEGSSGNYKVDGSSVSVNKEGTITPRNITWYWYGGYGYSTPQAGKTPDRIETSFYPGKSTVIVKVGQNTYKIDVNVVDYGNEYVEGIFNSYIKTNVTKKKDTLEKFKSITAFPAQYPYNGNYHTYMDMIIFQGGDCWGSSEIIQHFCEKIGIKSHIRYAANDPLSGSGHKNVAALINGKIYIGDAGYGYNTPNRPYSVSEKNIGFFYRSTNNGLIIYQYDGYDENINVPSTIEGKTVIGFENKCFYIGESYSKIKIKKITLPNTITSLGDYTFNNLINLEEVNIPSNITVINLDVFKGCDNLSYINIDKDNPIYSSVDGVLFDKNKTNLIRYPPGKKGNFTCPESLKKVKSYAFNQTKNIENIKFRDNINNIEENAFSNSNIKNVYFFGDKPEFGKKVFENLNITLYYPVNNTSWETIDLEDLGVKDARVLAWIPKEDEIKKEESDDDGSNVGLIIGIIIGVIFVIGIIIAYFYIRKRREKSSTNIDSIKGGLLNKM